jgi:hypothetical protein
VVIKRLNCEEVIKRSSENSFFVAKIMEVPSVFLYFLASTGQEFFPGLGTSTTIPEPVHVLSEPGVGPFHLQFFLIVQTRFLKL